MRNQIESSQGHAALVFYFLAPLVIWGVHLQVSYSLAPQSCMSRTKIILLIVSAICAAATASITYLSYRAFRIIPAEPGARGEDVTPPARASFLAIAGVVLGAYATLVIIAQTVPTVLLHPCD